MVLGRRRKEQAPIGGLATSLDYPRTILKQISRGQNSNGGSRAWQRRIPVCAKQGPPSRLIRPVGTGNTSKLRFSSSCRRIGGHSKKTVGRCLKHSTKCLPH